jgi:DNA-binding LytR/AlgR family response regulator
MRIAICDDEMKERTLLEEYIATFDPSLTYELFSSAAELQCTSKERFFDIIFMDIEMRQPNGYEVAAEMMTERDKPLIIFVTKSDDYTIRGYGIAFRYLKKPVEYAQFSQVLCLALDEVVPQKFPITTNGQTLVLSVREIYFFEIYRHELNVHTVHGVYTCRASLAEIIKQFAGTHFAQPHKSYFVNLAFVDRISAKDIVMTDGTNIPLSILRKEAFGDQFRRYMRG